jgi:hypothetical protein
VKASPATTRRKSNASLVDQIVAQLGDNWLPRIYRERILTLRTRSYEFPPLPKHSDIQIHHTLLGTELKVGSRRMLCPDLATARYLAIFARFGCKRAAIPYDITTISRLADELDSCWRRTLLLADEIAAGKSSSFHTRFRNQIIGKVRDEITEAGAGKRMPEFKRSTKQR